ncbi:MAG: (Fe-S)-binding protein [Eggerthellaceae bacterium]|nr:(Fe-S)-binding protein [Eggerthellaceae bacterium]
MTKQLCEQVFTDALAGSEIRICGPAFTSEKSAEGPSACSSLFFPGCSFLNADAALVAQVYSCLLEHRAVGGISLLCCGKLLRFGEAVESVLPAFQKKLVESIRHCRVERIVTACPNCVAEFRKAFRLYAPDLAIEVLPLSQVLCDLGFRIDADMLAAGQDPEGKALQCLALPLVAVHDSCPDRKSGEFAGSVRALFSPEMLVEMAHSRRESICCGSLANAAGRKELATSQALENGLEAQEAGAAAIVSYCISCTKYLNKRQNRLPAYHYLEFLFGKRLDWKNISPYLDIRFFFD